MFKNNVLIQKLNHRIMLTGITLTIMWLLINKSEAASFSKPESGVSNTCDCVCGVRGRSHRIVGGTTSIPHEQPWLASLRRQGKFYCGATVISNNFLLTAAHCVYSFHPSEIRIYLGGHEILKDFTEIRRIKKVYHHENFDDVSFDNDIALIELDKSIEFGPAVQPSCLPDENFTDYAGLMTLVAGWGKTGEKDKDSSKVLRSVSVPVWSREQCLESGYGKDKITENMMCGGYHDGGKDSCKGDSGGPMLLEGPTGSTEIIGVVSWGRGCARPNLPGIYTRIVNYMDWIKKKLNNECLCLPKNSNKV